MRNAGTSADVSPWLLGRDGGGRWVLRDRFGRRGGLLVSRAAAVGYVRIVSGNRAPLIVSAGAPALDPPDAP